MPNRGRNLFRITIVFSLIWTTQGRAENSMVERTWNVISSGDSCTQVDVNRAATCSLQTAGGELLLARRSAFEVFEDSVMQASATAQRQKNECVAEQVDAVMSRPEIQDAWMGFVLRAWLGMRKAQLIERKCRDLTVSNRLRNTDTVSRIRAIAVSRGGAVNAPGEPNRSAFDRWSLLCSSDETRSAMNRAERFFAVMPPIFSSIELLRTLDAQREHLRTRNPDGSLTALSDDEILSLQLPAGASSVVIDENLRASIFSALRSVGENRRRLTNELDAARQPEGRYNLDRDLRDFLYQDGTIVETLSRQGDIDIDAYGVPKTSTLSARCLLARYQPTFVGSILDFLTTAVVGGRVFTTVAAPAIRATAQSVPALRASATRMSTLYARMPPRYRPSAGTSIALGDQTARAAERHCFNRTRSISRLRSSAQDDRLVQEGQAGLPSETDFAPTLWPVLNAGSSSCTGDVAPAVSVNMAFETGCWAELYGVFEPLTVALPRLVLASH